MQALFDSKLRGLRRDRAARLGPELFLHQRAFDDCLERLELLERSFDRAILEFSHAYADQNERDYRELEKAVEEGRIVAQTGL